MRPPSDRRVGQAPVRFLDEKHQPHLQLTATTASLHRKFPPKSRNFAARQVRSANKDRRQLISDDLSVTLRPSSEFACTKRAGVARMSRAQEALQIEPGLKWYAIQSKPNRVRHTNTRRNELTADL